MRGPRASESVDGFAIIEGETAAEIRVGGCAGPIMVLEDFYERTDLDHFTAFDLEAVVYCTGQVQFVSFHRGRPLKVRLKVDSGMNRLGLTQLQLLAVLSRLLNSPNVDLRGVGRGPCRSPALKEFLQF